MTTTIKNASAIESRPARGGWIEICPNLLPDADVIVPPRKGRVD